MPTVPGQIAPPQAQPPKEEFVMMALAIEAEFQNAEPVHDPFNTKSKDKDQTRVPSGPRNP